MNLKIIVLFVLLLLFFFSFSRWPTQCLRSIVIHFSVERDLRLAGRPYITGNLKAKTVCFRRTSLSQWHDDELTIWTTIFNVFFFLIGSCFHLEFISEICFLSFSYVKLETFFSMAINAGKTMFLSLITISIRRTARRHRFPPINRVI